MNYPGFLLQRAIEVVWTCKYGAGGCSISGRLDLKGARRANSPAFKLIEDYFGRDNPGDYQKRDFDGFYAKLDRLFQDGRASPTELNAEGLGLTFVLTLVSMK